MKLDSTQRSWFFLSIAIFVACLAIYVPYALTAARGPTGGSALGLAFGIVGFAFMLFAAALGVYAILRMIKRQFRSPCRWKRDSENRMSIFRELGRPIQGRTTPV